MLQMHVEMPWDSLSICPSPSLSLLLLSCFRFSMPVPLTTFNDCAAMAAVHNVALFTQCENKMTMELSWNYQGIDDIIIDLSNNCHGSTWNCDVIN